MDMDRGVLYVPEDFDAPLPPDLQAAFDGESAPDRKEPKLKGRRKRL